MNWKTIILCCWGAWCSVPVVAQKKQITIGGYISDATDGEKLIGATIKIQPGKGVITNEYGFYSINVLPTDSVLMFKVSYVGYITQKIAVKVQKDTFLNIALMPAGVLQEVEIIAQKDPNKPTDGSVIALSSDQIKQLPRLLGEADALRALQLLPGIQGGSEGSSSLHVRGGSPDQNLILLDDIPLYFVNHLGGFLSVIDANSINAIKLYKGGFPARYAGRLSAILDVRLKEGNRKTWEKTVSLGVLSSKVSISGPLKKDKASLFISARRSNLDYLSRLQSVIQGDNKFSAGFWFYDSTLKLNWDLGEKDHLMISSYTSADKLFLEQRQKKTAAVPPIKSEASLSNGWSNVGIGLRWNHLFSERLFSNFTSAYTRFIYQNNVSVQRWEGTGFDSLVNGFSNGLRSGINDWSNKAILTWNINSEQTLRVGGNVVLHFFDQPGTSFIQQGENPVNVQFGGKRLFSLENGVFGEVEGQLGKKITYNIGLHAALLWLRRATFFSPQPRVNIVYECHPHANIHISYARMSQFLHLLSNTGAGLPTDLWVPATNAVPPSISDQVTFGTAWALPGEITMDIELFYKKIDNIIEFQQGASFTSAGGDWQDKVFIGGQGVVLGTELFVKKIAPRWEAWISYTLSSNRRQFNQLNNGAFFPYKYDKPHVIHLVGIWKPNKTSNLSVAWNFESGQVITLPTLGYAIETFGPDANGIIYGFNPDNAYLYSGRNNYRLPNYHRLDINYNKTKTRINKKGRKIERTFTIGAYNLYNRQNPYFVFYDKKNGQTKLFQLTLFPILPYISVEYQY
jgi:TonB-dependent Receptor Plug Domain/CarboxypepD_reg-like domain